MGHDQCLVGTSLQTSLTPAQPSLPVIAHISLRALSRRHTVIIPPSLHSSTLLPFFLFSGLTLLLLLLSLLPFFYLLRTQKKSELFTLIRLLVNFKKVSGVFFFFFVRGNFHGSIFELVQILYIIHSANTHTFSPLLFDFEQRFQTHFLSGAAFRSI